MKRNINRGEVFQLEKKVLKDNSDNLKDDFLTEYTHLWTERRYWTTIAISKAAKEVVLFSSASRIAAEIDGENTSFLEWVESISIFQSLADYSSYDLQRWSSVRKDRGFSWSYTLKDGPVRIKFIG
ncbi:hypothetical protein RCL_jg14771.t1 [Rhizophagus clarus]|uniref:Uncharacterized protein n=1 Tax=Rhizophagus clarus TaxID=94130 RepID=A0A8H3LXH8_9GLOM|nr:hypothetical protein RCL_jg14771.t1 [Rhizophagus clarus]